MHIPVLFQESIDALCVRPDGMYVDGTLGGAGHAEGIAKILSATGTLIGFDLDQNAIDRANVRLADFPCHKIFIADNFRNMSAALDAHHVINVDGILLDLGWSSYQIADAARGFSFQADGPLLMTLRDTVGPEDITAWDIVNTWGEETLADIFYAYGDETAARKIARAIVAHRKHHPFQTTIELAAFIKELIAKNRHTKIHPATRVFQALRIAVNDEYGALRECLETVITRVNHTGRIAVITFHSGEDRIVKHLMRDWADRGLGTVITKKPMIPTDDESKSNPRARSAKLRIFELS